MAPTIAMVPSARGTPSPNPRHPRSKPPGSKPQLKPELQLQLQLQLAHQPPPCHTWASLRHPSQNSLKEGYQACKLDCSGFRAASNKKVDRCEKAEDPFHTPIDKNTSKQIQYQDFTLKTKHVFAVKFKRILGNTKNIVEEKISSEQLINTCLFVCLLACLPDCSLVCLIVKITTTICPQTEKPQSRLT